MRKTAFLVEGSTVEKYDRMKQNRELIRATLLVATVEQFTRSLLVRRRVKAWLDKKENSDAKV